MPPRPFRVAAVLATSLVTACSGADKASAAPETEPSFTLSASGDVTRTATGFTLTAYLRDGFTEITGAPGGERQRQSSDVTLIALALDGPAGPQVSIGLLGRAAVGTYRVRAGGTPIGERPEFYADYAVPNADGTRRSYSASTGTVTITSTSPTIRGTFEFH